MKTRLTLSKFIDELIYQVVLGNRYLSDAAELPDSEYKVLRFVERHPKVHMKTIAEFLGVSLPRATVVIDHLVAKGLIARCAGSDRRVVDLVLTDKGTEAIIEAKGMHDELSEAILSPLTQSERAQMYVLLQKCYNSLKDKSAT